MKFKMLGGDFPQSATVSKNWLNDNLYVGQINLTGKIESVEVITEENKKKILGAFGWGAAGWALLGPLGAIAGVLKGGRKTEVCFACVLKDGRRFVAIADAALYQLLVLERLKAQPRLTSKSEPQSRPASPSAPTLVCSSCGQSAAPQSRFCPNCGHSLASVSDALATSLPGNELIEQQSYSVVINGIAPSRKIYVVKAMRELTIWTLGKTVDMAEQATSGVATVIEDGMTKENALAAYGKLKLAGAYVYVLDSSEQKVDFLEAVSSPSAPSAKLLVNDSEQRARTVILPTVGQTKNYRARTVFATSAIVTAVLYLALFAAAAANSGPVLGMSLVFSSTLGFCVTVGTGIWYWRSKPKQTV